jgi:hypothetical protein
MIEELPRNLSTLDAAQLERARSDRDERMSILFRRWPTVNNAEMRELRKLSHDRQRLARHVGTLHGLHALRSHPAPRAEATR